MAGIFIFVILFDFAYMHRLQIYADSYVIKLVNVVTFFDSFVNIISHALCLVSAHLQDIHFVEETSPPPLHIIFCVQIACAPAPYRCALKGTMLPDLLRMSSVCHMPDCTNFLYNRVTVY